MTYSWFSSGYGTIELTAINKVSSRSCSVQCLPRRGMFMRCRPVDHSLVSDLAGSVAVTRMLDLLDLRVHARLLGSVSTCSFQ
jgi:hypothetical protein